MKISKRSGAMRVRLNFRKNADEHGTCGKNVRICVRAAENLSQLRVWVHTFKNMYVGCNFTLRR